MKLLVIFLFLLLTVQVFSQKLENTADTIITFGNKSLVKVEQPIIRYEPLRFKEYEWSYFDNGNVKLIIFVIVGVVLILLFRIFLEKIL